MEHLIAFAKQYREAINKYANTHFQERGKFFTPNMVQELF